MVEEKICKKCVLPSSTPGIKFDKSGVCNYCNSYVPMSVRGQEELIKIFEEEKKKSQNKRYDCMVGISGGRDSTFVLLKLVKDYRLRVLAVNYENPFASPQAKQNIEKACAILKVDKLVWRYPKGEHEKATKKALKIWSRHPSSKMIPIVCAHCKSWWPKYFRIARDNKIGLIVIGSNPLETASFKKVGFGGARYYHKFVNMPKIILKVLQELSKNISYLSLSWGLIAKMYLAASHSTPYMKWLYSDINVIRLFDFLRWDEKEIEGRISRELGWRKSDEIESSWRFDCRLDYIRRYMYAATVGVTELQDLYSKMIREGMITREEAFERLKKENRVSKDIVSNVLEQLDLNFSDLNLNYNTKFLK